MGIFGGKRKEVIPDVPAPNYSQPKSVSTNYNTPPSSNGGRPAYNSAPPSQRDYNVRPTYNSTLSNTSGRSVGPPSSYNNVGNANGNGYNNHSNARSELLSGAPSADRQQQLRAQSLPYESTEGADEDEETEGIKQNMRFVKQESLASTRNANRIAREAVGTAMATYNQLGDQADRLGNARANIDRAYSYGDRANDQVTEIKALNKSIFRPNLTINKQAKRDKEEARLNLRHQNEQEEREALRQNQMDSRARAMGVQMEAGRMAEQSYGMRGKGAGRGTKERSRYQFEQTESDDEVEDEIDDNLNELSGTVAQLKMLALASGQEVTRSIQQIEAMSGRVDEVDMKVVGVTNRMAKIKS